MPTVLHRLAQWAESDPKSAAQRFKLSGRWETITAKEYMDRVYHLALFLESRGLTSKDTGCVFSPNNPQWVHMDLATLLIGAKSAGIYPNSIDKDIRYVIDHTEASVLSVNNREFFDKIITPEKDYEIPARVKTIVVFDRDASFHPRAITYEAALKEGQKLALNPSARKLSEFLKRLDPKAGAFMIYTSGTTGNPKGALLSHDNFVFTSDTIAKFWGLPYSDGSLFSFLPLCHVAEKLQSVAVGISQRYTVNFATKFEMVSQELPEIQPKLLLCVPRLWEKMVEGVTHKVDLSSPVKKKLAQWAFAVCARVSDAKYSGKSANPLDLIQLKIADQLVLKKVRHALGVAGATALASGAATLPAHVSKWFRALQPEILECFGQTESTGAICLTIPKVDCAGTVGKPIANSEFKIAEDGEILTKGRHVFVGYFKNPEATADTLKDGWLHTGDLGEFDDKGMVKIRGRKKEIMKTSGGKMVAPLPIEEKLKESPIISQVCMVGDNRKFISALITLSEAKMHEVKGKIAGDAQTITDPETLSAVRVCIDDLNRSLASYEQIKKFTVLAREFSIADGEMTPTLKMKRNVIEQRFSGVIDSMYA